MLRSGSKLPNGRKEEEKKTEFGLDIGLIDTTKAHDSELQLITAL
jgi:hypothetical protein